MAKKTSARDVFNRRSKEAQVEQFEAAAATVNDFGPRIKLNEGMNILWLLPGRGTSHNFIEAKKIHYGPMHVCGRQGKIVDPRTAKTVDDRDFKKCYRCISASNAWKAVGNPGKGDSSSKDPHKEKFKDDMPNDGGLVQAVDFSPFFVQKGRGGPVFNEKLAEYLPAFLDAIGGNTDALEELPNDDMKSAAEAGICPVIVNETLMNDLRATEESTTDSFAVRAKKDADLKAYVTDGLDMHPEAFLVYIDRGKDQSRPFKGRNGQTMYPAKYVVSYLTSDHLLDNWGEALPIDPLFDLAAEFSIDLNDPRTTLDDGADLNAMAQSFVRLDGEEMEKYLKERGHSFQLAAQGGESAGGTTVEEGAGIDLSDPDAFDDEGASEAISDAAAKAAVAEARALRSEAEA